MSATAGLSVAEPKTKCEDERCPFHGSLKVRGRLLSGKVVSTSGRSFVVVQMDHLHKVGKYNRVERRRSRLSAHLPGCIQPSEGDTVQIAECRPLSKTISFVVVEARGRS
jgi:small subunit ribosomal protein S17